MIGGPQATSPDVPFPWEAGGARWAGRRQITSAACGVLYRGECGICEIQEELGCTSGRERTVESTHHEDGTLSRRFSNRWVLLGQIRPCCDSKGPCSWISISLATCTATQGSVICHTDGTRVRAFWAKASVDKDWAKFGKWIRMGRSDPRAAREKSSGGHG